MNGIKTSEELRKAVDDVIGGKKDRLLDLAKYKYYNYYMAMHVQMGSEEDIKNEAIWLKLFTEHRDIHDQVEELIDREIEKLDIEF